jgi:hypothetical protein
MVTPRLCLLAARVHALGPGPLAHLLAELAAGARPMERIEAYARLEPLAGFIAALDGNELPGWRIIDGGRQ